MAKSRVIGKSELGQRYGKLTVIAPYDPHIQKNGCRLARWLCLCVCGKETIVQQKSLRSGNTKSCGCVSREKIRLRELTHGKSKTSIYNIWIKMIQRCHNENNKNYKDYGGRGITVCQEWRDNFECFDRDMGTRPVGYTIERKDNNLGYCKENCRWASRAEQCYNRRSNVFVEFQGKRMILSEAIRRAGLPKNAVTQRLRLGWPIEKALTTPIRPQRRRLPGPLGGVFF